MNNLELTEEQIKRRKRANIAALINDFDDIESTNIDISEQIINHGKISDNIYELYLNLDLKEAQSIIDKLDLSNSSIVTLVNNDK